MEQDWTAAARPRWGRRLAAMGLSVALVSSAMMPSVASAQVAGFPDVPADSPHAPAIADLQQRGVVQGKQDGTFGFRDLLTRAQLASILARAEGLEPKADGPFSDVSGPHAGAINALADREIILGKGDGTFDPQGTITRDQVASMLARYLELDEVATGPFRDVPAANVHAGSINALAAIEVALGNDRGEYQPRNQLRRDQAASFVSRALAHADGGPGAEPGCPFFEGERPGTVTGQPEDGFTPSITVSDTEGVEFGETVTVTGSGFDPESNPGTRPPLFGQPAGVYVIFGNYNDDWRPSEGGENNVDRVVGDQRWAVPNEPPALVNNPQYVPLTDEGTFDLELTVTETDTEPGGPDGYGVYVYAAGGAENANHELDVPVSVGSADQDDAASITWGVKTSFRNYVTGGIANGSITTDGAVTQAASNGPFTWEANVLGHGLRSSDGVVTFSGHGDQLRFVLSDVHVDVGGETLYADVTSRELEDDADDVEYADVAFAELDVDGATWTAEGGVVTCTGIGATLTEEGEPAFAGFYEAGEALDPVTLTFAAAG